MTPSVGSFYDANAMYLFSDCSIESFKNTLLTPDLQYIVFINNDISSWIKIINFRDLTEQGSCLSKAPGQLQQEFESVYGKNTLPGRIFSVDEQCRLIYGKLSFYCKGVRIKNLKFEIYLCLYL